MTKIILLSDNHSGHLMGMTHPDYPNEKKIDEIMTPFWNWWMTTKKSEYDVMLHLGDCIEGPDTKDSGFLRLPDISEQQENCIKVLKSANAKKHIFCYGTPYHVSTGNIDFEKTIAEKMGDFGISWMRKIDVDGVKFNMQHTIGKTSTPVGGDIMLRKQLIWNKLMSEPEGVEKADYIIRGHVHEYRSVSDVDTTVMTLPALKIGNADYDRYPRRMSGGFYNVGFCEMVVDNGKVLDFTKHIYKVNLKQSYERI
jgi:predicted phosphodiesterase